MSESARLGVHDVASGLTATSLDELRRHSPWLAQEAELEVWEKQIHAALVQLVKGSHMSIDELRRGVETLPPGQYAALTCVNSPDTPTRHTHTHAGLLIAVGSQVLRALGGGHVGHSV